MGKEPRMGGSDSSPVRAGRRLEVRVEGEGCLGAARGGKWRYRSPAESLQYEIPSKACY